ncbi:MAG: T9SS type A sorting domain-containing protein, partial [Chloroflexota bacterium]
MKGFREWKNQRHEYYPLDIFYDFVEVSGVRTKAYYNDQFEGTPQYNYRDSSFYDISLLSDHSVDSNMTKVFYLGVLNRRTNPLVMEDDTLQFYPTYEWDLNVRNGGERLWGQAEDSLYWREKFWQRMGCRDIRIPFQYRHGTDNPSTKLRVVELGFDNPEIKSWNWRQPEYYHTVDTVISWDETLSARFLPGEGKILKVTPVNFGESGVDTCQGCEALKNHVRASATPVRCEGLQHKWDVTLENLSGCDYDNLSLIVKSDDNSAQYLNVGAGNTGFTINQEIANGQRVWTLQGALAQGAEVTFPFSISSAYSVDYQITWGEWVDGMLIECDSALLSGRVVKSDCELIGVTVTDTGDSCLCGAEWKPSEKEITIFVPDTQPCVEEVKITRFLPHINPPLIEELTLAGDGVHVEADSGTYLTFRFCPWEDWQVKVQLFSGDDKLCESEFKSPVCDCDTIKITSIWNMIYPSNDKLGYKFDFRKIIDCATAYDVAEVLPNGALAVVKPNVAIPDTGISGEWLSSADFEFRKYIIIAKNRDCAPPCYSDTIKVPPKHWTNPAQINTTANFLVDSLPCMAGIIARRDDTLSKEIYGITVFEGREPYALLYSEMRNPASQPPIDLRVPGGYHITNIVFPCDSALKLIVKYWDEDTVCVAVGEIDTTCGSGDDYEYLESLSAYPNPASEEVTLDYEMKKGAHVELEIIDAQGNTKKKSIKAFKDKGKHSLTFQLDGLQTGIYYVALRAEGEAMARRIVIIK